MKAAVLHAPGQPLAIEDLDLAAPKAGEILVRLVATGVCHSDLSTARGGKIGSLPLVLGHEGAGVVENIGPGVSTVAAGDRVLLASVPRCGKCPACIAGKPYVCSNAAAGMYGGGLFDGTTRLSLHGQPVYHFFKQSSFAERAVVPEGAAVRVPPEAPLDKVAVLACGVRTGLGAVLNAADVEIGDTVAVIGCGGVGLGGIIAASLRHAGAIIAVDLAEDKLELARSMGATHTVNASDRDAVEAVRQISGGGVNHAFEFAGNPKTVAQAVQMLAVGGNAYVVGGSPPGSRYDIPADGFLADKHLHGLTLGNVRAQLDIPRYIELYLKGKLPLDRLVTRRYPLEQVNEALAALDGSAGRGVISFE
ncbi:MAG TPA: alcohol dehydrogenase catalytic domain-containing protein [Chloroflexota bacterium]|nr:alcohol dehydrogenase catalytic domain-containing protein [Chloroflexota bacterium]